jgi:dTMP kinase
VREPGGNETCEKIRDLLYTQVDGKLVPEAEALIYAASRAQLVQETILPALKEGKIVISDRFLDSSIAYQGFGRKLGAKRVEDLNDFALQGFRPDVTVFLSLDYASAQKRMENRGLLNALDKEEEPFHTAVRQGFDYTAKSHPERVVIADASKDEESVFHQVLSIIENALEKAGCKPSGKKERA